MQRRLLGAFDPIERIWATVSSSRAGIMLPEVEDAGRTEGGREGGDVLSDFMPQVILCAITTRKYSLNECDIFS